MHTLTREMPFGGTTSADSYEAGTRAAACGGVTTVFDFVIQRKGKVSSKQ